MFQEQVCRKQLWGHLYQEIKPFSVTKVQGPGKIHVNNCAGKNSIREQKCRGTGNIHGNNCAGKNIEEQVSRMKSYDQFCMRILGICVTGTYNDGNKCVGKNRTKKCKLICWRL